MIDGVTCSSMEGFLQSLKFRSMKKQRQVCRLSGKAAKNAPGRLRNWRWKFSKDYIGMEGLTNVLRWTMIT